MHRSCLNYSRAACIPVKPLVLLTIIVLILVATLVSAPGSSAQSDATTFLSNLGQTTGPQDSRFKVSQAGWASQPFTTGPDENGYDLTSVTLQVNKVDFDPQAIVRLHATDPDHEGPVTDSMGQLATPENLVIGSNQFTLSSAVTLDPETRYHIVVRGRISLDHTATLETDRNSASRWRLHDVLVNSVTPIAGKTLQLSIKGNLIRFPPGTPTNPSAEAGNTAVTLTWQTPTEDGGSDITGYQYRQMAAGDTEYGTETDAGDTTSHGVSGLINGTEYTFQIRAVNAVGAGSWSEEATATPNAAPTFPEAAPPLSFPENTAGGTNIDPAVTATDDAGDTLTYSLEGADAGSFRIDGSTGQVSTKAKAEVTYDHEAKASYSVTVRATDSHGAISALDVTIAVEDVDEPPAAPATPTVTTEDITSVSVTWVAPDNAGKPDINDYDVRYRQVGNPSWTDANHNGIGLTATITGLGSGTEYEAQARAANEEGAGEWSPSGTGGTRGNSPATGQPVITGFLLIGRTATAAPGDIGDIDGLNNVTYRYQWIRIQTNDSEAVINGAVGATYTLSSDDIGKRIKVKASFTDDQGFSESRTSDATVAVEGPPSVTIMSDGDVGEGAAATFTISRSGARSQQFALTVSYEVTESADMLAGTDEGSGKTVTFAAASSTATISVATAENLIHQEDSTVTVTLEASADYVVGTPGSAEATVTDNDNAPAAGTIQISGTTHVGQTLTAQVSDIVDADGLTNVSYTYQWSRVEADDSATDIGGATSSVYMLVNAGVGKRVAATVSFDDDSNNAETLVSTAVGPVIGVAGPPTGLSAQRGDQQVTLSWAAPTSNGGSTVTDYEYEVGNDGNWQSTGGTNTTYTVTGLNNGQSYTFRVRAVNAVGAGPESDSGSATLQNSAPTFAQQSYARSVDENSGGGTAVGSPVTATDPEGGALSYSLSGTDSNLFSISSSGQIRTASKASLDHETTASHTLTISASDGRGNSATATVNISVADVDEPPDAPGAPTVTSGGLTGIQVTWNAPDNAGRPAITDYDVQYRKQGASSWADASHTGTGTSVSINGLEPGTTYGAQVRASNAEGTGAWSQTGSGGTGNNTPATGAPEITGMLLVGQTMTASPGTIADDNGLTKVSYTYRWLRGSSAIGEALSMTYTLVEADAGQTISVRLSFSDDAGFSEARTSAATVAVERHPTISVSALADPQVIEGDTASFPLTRTGTLSLASSLTVTYRVLETGNMLADSHQGGVNTITFAANAATEALSVPTVNDDTDEPDSVVTVTLTTGPGYAVGTSDSTRVTVSDNDGGTTPTATPTSTATATPTSTATPTRTATPTPAATPTPTPTTDPDDSTSPPDTTPAPTARLTMVPTTVPSPTPPATPVPTVLPTPVLIPTVMPTVVPTVRPTQMPSITPQRVHDESDYRPPAPTLRPTPTLTPELPTTRVMPSVTPTPTLTPTATPTRAAATVASTPTALSHAGRPAGEEDASPGPGQLVRPMLKIPLVSDAIPRIQNALASVVSTPRARITLVTVLAAIMLLSVGVFTYLILRRT